LHVVAGSEAEVREVQKMRYAILGARIVLGLIFLVFGLNGILHLISTPTPTGDAAAWYSQGATHQWMNFVSLVELICGVLLLVNRFVPLALILLTPTIVNMLVFRAVLWPQGAWLIILALILEIFLIAVYWRTFLPLLNPNPEEKQLRR
jgi:putative oxidoreductase